MKYVTVLTVTILISWKFILIITALLAGMLAAALAVQTVSAARQYREETERGLQEKTQTQPLQPTGLPPGGQRLLHRPNHRLLIQHGVKAQRQRCGRDMGGAPC